VRLILSAEDKRIGEHVIVISEQKYHPGIVTQVTEHGAQVKGINLGKSEGGFKARMHTTSEGLRQISDVPWLTE
jgi:fructose-1,6-bisphosphatase/sedoheptulose 1,7-bisphosphatase-like protein